MFNLRRLSSHIIFALLLCAIVTPTFSQNRYYQQWFFGFNAGADFTTSPPSKLFGALFSREGCASICDPGNGSLLFYTNGISVWNRNHGVMRNGTGLLGSSTSTQSATIVPKPGDPSIFYIFTTSGGPYEPLPVGTARQVAYSVVDMRREGGLGEVLEKNVPLMQPSAEKLVAIQHCNGVDFWVIGHELGSRRFFTWLVTAAGISRTPTITDIGLYHDPDPLTTGSIGYLKASPDGRFLFSVVQQEGKGQLFEFDNENGTIGDVLATVPAHYGASFSPNSELLYVPYPVPSPKINRYVIILNGNLLGPSEILGTERTIVQLPSSNPPRSFRALQIGLDRKIYVGVDKHVGMIDNPDQGGIFRDSVITYEPPGLIGDSISTNGFPNCIDGFLSSEPVPSCAEPITAKFSQSDTAICEGETIDFVDESFENPLEWQWTFEGGIPSTSNVRHPKGVRYDLAGTYTVRLIASSGREIDTAIGTVRVHPKPIADAGNDRVICTGDTVHLNGEGGGSYQWTPAVGLSCTDCANPVASPSETTVYRVRVTNEFGCEGSDSVRVEVQPQITIVVSPDTAICAGGSLQLRASGADRYEWSPSEELSCPLCPDPVVSPAKTTTFYVRGMTGTGSCFDIDSVTVVVNDLPVADAGGDTALCLGASVRLSATGGLLYRWNSSLDLSCLDCPDPIASPSTTTTYLVTVIDDNGCEGIDSVRVDVYPLPVADAGEGSVICRGGSVALRASGGVGYRWNDSPDLSCLDCPDPLATPMERTTYYVTVTDERGCQAIDSVLIDVRSAPVVDAGADTAICHGASVELRASGGTSYRWDPSPDLSCFDCANPVAHPSVTTVYYVTVTDEGGCVGRDSVVVDIHPFKITVGPDQLICPGDAAQLSVDGGIVWMWEPSESLSCSDCPAPVASPSVTTTYRVTARSAEGCMLVDSMQVRVRDSREMIRVRIGREHTALPGNLLLIPVEVFDPIINSDIDELQLTLQYDPNVMVLDAESIRRLLDRTLLEGWSVEIDVTSPGRAVAHLTAPPGERLAGIGTLLLFEARLYLSSVQGTELPLQLSSPTNCFGFETEDGYARVDSICGLHLRLIEIGVEKYAAPHIYPNPATEQVRIEFGLGLSGSTRLEVLDAAGDRIGLLVDAHLEEGGYEVEWDVTNIPSGLYYCRLTSGDWSRVERVMIVR